jgi:hypothetical protein
MAEPVSLAFACVEAFKEVFLLSRAVYRILKSSKQEATERRDLQAEFYHELLFLRDFGNRFLRAPNSLGRDEVSLQILGIIGYP